MATLSKMKSQQQQQHTNTFYISMDIDLYEQHSMVHDDIADIKDDEDNMLSEYDALSKVTEEYQGQQYKFKGYANLGAICYLVC